MELYKSSKLCNILFTNEANRRCLRPASDVRCCAVERPSGTERCAI